MPEVLGVDGGLVLLLGATVLVGAVVQGVAGLGVGIVSAPVVTLLAPDLMPGMLLSLALVMPAFTLSQERADIDWHGLGWTLPTRVLGTVVGTALVALVDPRWLGVGVAVMVLVAVVTTVRAVVVPVNRGTLATVGLVSGVAGTATSIGGPPMALLYQHRPPTQVRSTLAVYFAVGAALSLLGLAFAHSLPRHQIAVALLLVPALLVGSVLAPPVRRHLDGPGFRRAVLAVCTLSALALLARSLVA